MCVCVCVYNNNAHAHTNVCICTHTHVYTCTHTCIHMHTHKHTKVYICARARSLSHAHQLANGLAHTRRRTTHSQLPHRPTRVSAHMRGTPGPNCRAPPGLQAAGGQTLLWQQDSLSHKKSRGLSGCRCKRLRVSSLIPDVVLDDVQLYACRSWGSGAFRAPNGDSLTGTGGSRR